MLPGTVTAHTAEPLLEPVVVNSVVYTDPSGPTIPLPSWAVYVGYVSKGVAAPDVKSSVTRVACRFHAQVAGTHRAGVAIVEHADSKARGHAARAVVDLRPHLRVVGPICHPGVRDPLGLVMHQDLDAGVDEGIGGPLAGSSVDHQKVVGAVVTVSARLHTQRGYAASCTRLIERACSRQPTCHAPG